MPKSKRDQKRERNRIKRQQKRKEMSRAAAENVEKFNLRAAADWPILSCWVNEGWEDLEVINQVIVARQDDASGRVAVGMYLVDRACLGVKDAMIEVFPNAAVFRQNLLERVAQTQDIVEVDFNLAAAIVDAGRVYAEGIGFYPHKDFRSARILLQGADLTAVREPIPVGGKDGKPFFIAGPYDNVQSIVAKLTRRLGPDGFQFMAPLEMLGPDFSLDDLERLAEDDEDVIDGVIVDLEEAEEAEEETGDAEA